MSLLEESVVVCRNCGENGHWTLKCPKRDQLSTSTSASASTSTFTPAASPKHADVTTVMNHMSFCLVMLYDIGYSWTFHCQLPMY